MAMDKLIRYNVPGQPMKKHNLSGEKKFNL